MEPQVNHQQKPLLLYLFVLFQEKINDLSPLQKNATNVPTPCIYICQIFILLSNPYVILETQVDKGGWRAPPPWS